MTKISGAAGRGTPLLVKPRRPSRCAPPGGSAGWLGSQQLARSVRPPYLPSKPSSRPTLGLQMAIMCEASRLVDRSSSRTMPAAPAMRQGGRSSGASLVGGTTEVDYRGIDGRQHATTVTARLFLVAPLCVCALLLVAACAPAIKVGHQGEGHAAAVPQ